MPFGPDNQNDSRRGESSYDRSQDRSHDRSYDRHDGPAEDFWSDFHSRWEARRARRAERYARRAQRYAERGARYARWAQHSAYWSGFAQDIAHGVVSGVASARARAGSAGTLADIRAKVEEMARDLKDLANRVAALEKLATDPDQRLREEIEKLRREDRAGRPGPEDKR